MALIKMNHMKAKQIGKARCNLATKIDSSVVSYLIMSKNKMKEMQKKKEKCNIKDLCMRQCQERSLNTNILSFQNRQG